MLEQQNDTAPLSGHHIDIPRLISDLSLSERDFRTIASLPITDTVVVASGSAIKIDAVSAALEIAFPSREFTVVGVKVPSGVPEQPLGSDARTGALNRMSAALSAIHDGHIPEAPSENPVTVISIENGLFEETPPLASKSTETDFDGAIMNSEYAPDREYEDRAITAIHLPGLPAVIQISPKSEAVHIPAEALCIAMNAPKDALITVGSVLVTMGAVKDRQNPQRELTLNRPGGPLPREDQMARSIIRGFLHAATLLDQKATD